MPLPFFQTDANGLHITDRVFIPYRFNIGLHAAGIAQGNLQFDLDGSLIFRSDDRVQPGKQGIRFCTGLIVAFPDFDFDDILEVNACGQRCLSGNRAILAPVDHLEVSIRVLAIRTPNADGFGHFVGDHHSAHPLDLRQSCRSKGDAGQWIGVVQIRAHVIGEFREHLFYTWHQHWAARGDDSLYSAFTPANSRQSFIDQLLPA